MGTGNGIHFGLLNLEPTILSDATLDQIAATLQKQLRSQVAPNWYGAGALATVQRITDAKSFHGIVAYCQDSLDVAGALAYHTVNGNGAPAIYASQKVSQHYGSELSEDLSHELIETTLDPECVRVVVGRSPRHPNLPALIMWEACDPTQRSYLLDGIKVSDFVFPNYFSEVPGQTRFMIDGDYLPPYEILDTGYLAYSESLNGPWSQYFGSDPKAKRAHFRAAFGLPSRIGHHRKLHHP